METLILGTRYTKQMKITLILLAFAAMFEPLTAFVDKFILSDWEFMGMMALLVVFDTATGMYAAWRLHVVSSKKMIGVPIKIVVYGISLSVIHIVSTATVNGQPNSAMAEIAQWFDSIVYTFLMFRETLSINENLGKVNMGILPAFLMKRIQDFNEKGKFDASPPPAVPLAETQPVTEVAPTPAVPVAPPATNWGGPAQTL